MLTVSLHESGYTAFPGTGFPKESGHGAAEGTAVNVALPPGIGDAGWLRAFHAVVPPLVRAFEPQILLTQLGCDTHRLDPMAQLNLTVDAHRHSYAALHQLAHEVAGGRWVAVGGGGYYRAGHGRRRVRCAAAGPDPTCRRPSPGPSRTNNGLPAGDIENSPGVALLHSHPRQLLMHLGKAEWTQVETLDTG